MGKKEQRNITSLTTSFGNAFQVDCFSTRRIVSIVTDNANNRVQELKSHLLK